MEKTKFHEMGERGKRETEGKKEINIININNIEKTNIKGEVQNITI